ncbi:hypothetical protein DVT68_02565 [Dyella solisilvae]|uniref:Sel1 repeat family protein n=1 Tax=Dyella solisilvae TaxID=1920168 RepID=A0A370KAR4_9GAMM|nr:hypothetical protein [Dyella solisilvae]RDI99744.1 hypothetical protein DVT68_02565 [Dyella solisilvae]
MQGKRAIWPWGLAVALLASPLAVLGQSASGVPLPDSEPVPTDADLANTQCAIGEERFLPGDYYYCLGKQSYGNHRYASSQRFFTTAASWASKPAQYVLGIMALNGDQQPVNRPLALAWLALAAERSGSDYEQAYQAAYAKASDEERKAAEQLLVGMRPIYGDGVAAKRAEQRYAAGMAELTRLSRSGGQYCMAGAGNTAQPTTNPTSCPPAQLVVKAVDAAAANVFDGWVGHVQVGELEQATPPDDGKRSK